MCPPPDTLRPSEKSCQTAALTHTHTHTRMHTPRPHTPRQACTHARTHTRMHTPWRAGRGAVLNAHLVANTRVPFLSEEVGPGQEWLRGRVRRPAGWPSSRDRAGASHLLRCSPGGQPGTGRALAFAHAASHRVGRCGTVPARCGGSQGVRTLEATRAPRQKEGQLCFSNMYTTRGVRLPEARLRGGGRACPSLKGAAWRSPRVGFLYHSVL